jgi:ribosomal protein S25
MTKKEKILNRLQEQLDYAIEMGYKKDRILGIFLYGSQNYNLDTEDSDIDSKIIYVPSFEEFCFNKEWVSKELHCAGEHAEVKDIRLMRQMFMKQNINFIELLYTDYYILNPKYEELWRKYFINNREDISHYDMREALSSMCGQGIFHVAIKDNIIPSDKKIANGLRLCYFLRDYLAGAPYVKCLDVGTYYPDRAEIIKKIKAGKHEALQDNEGKEGYCNGIKNTLLDLLEKFQLIDSPRHEAAATALDTGTMEILKASFNFSKSISRKEFMSELSNAETKAYYSIVDEIGVEGNISISTLVKKYCISRPVYNNLIAKMKNKGVAEVFNQGVKGTYVNITNSELITEIEERKQNE